MAVLRPGPLNLNHKKKFTKALKLLRGAFFIISILDVTSEFYRLELSCLEIRTKTVTYSALGRFSQTAEWSPFRLTKHIQESSLFLRGMLVTHYPFSNENICYCCRFLFYHCTLGMLGADNFSFSFKDRETMRSLILSRQRGLHITQRAGL